MSIKGGYIVYCDAIGCDRRMGASSPLSTKTAARDYARHHGWAVSREAVRCPRHRRPMATHPFTVGDNPYACVMCGGHAYLLVHTRA